MPGTDEKVIYYEPAGRIHSTQWELINNPPEGYRFVTKKINFIIRNDFIFNRIRLQYLDRLMPLNYVKAKLDSKTRMPEADMIFAYNHLVFRNIPWVVLVEWSNILIGRDLKFRDKYKKSVEKSLMSDNCKGIMTWSAIARDSILQDYNVPKDKVTVIPHAVKSVEIHRDYDRNQDNPHLLFVGSVNTSEDFAAKGATDVIKAFGALRIKYRGLRLTVRAKTPKEWSHPIDGLRVINRVLPRQELNSLFSDADIFILPSHLCQELVLVDAMNYGLPIITSWVGSTCGEYVENDLTGLVLSKPTFPYFTEDNMLLSETTHRPEIISDASKHMNTALELENTIDRLIADKGLRERLGKAAKTEVDNGRFSIEHRNKLLLEVLRGHPAN